MARVEQDEVWCAMERLSRKLRRAPGADGVRPEHVLKAPGQLLDHLTALHTACVAREYYPAQWSVARVLAVPKTAGGVHLPRDVHPQPPRRSLSLSVDSL